MKLRTAIATATTAAVLATSGVAIAGAAGNSGPTTPPSSAPATSPAPPATPAAVRPAALRARVRLRALIRRGAVAVITKTIGIDRATLRQDVLAGQTIAQIATANNVSPQTVIDALVTAATNKLNAAAQAGKIKPARVAKIEQQLPARVEKLVNTWHPKRAKTTAS
jgi:hypothetical protein